MSKIEDGGPAFPTGYRECDVVEIEGGMSLRDWFAGQALAALSKDFRQATGISANIRNIATLNADLAYLVADAMIERRGKQ